jgi:hypothetical protein
MKTLAINKSDIFVRLILLALEVSPYRKGLYSQLDG